MKNPDFNGLSAMFINCTLKKFPDKSHTQALMDVSEGIMEREGVKTENIRFIDHDIATGIQPDMTENGWETDKWPELFKKIIAADILVIGSPIWLGERSSMATKLVERLYAMSAVLNDEGQSKFYGRVGGCIITGNEDGVKHVSMGLLYSLQHLGYSIPPQADCGWLGKIGPGPSYLDEGSDAENSDFTNKNTTFMTYNLLHLAKMLKDNGGYSNYGNDRNAWKDGERWEFQKPKAKL
ncbi:flavodoxin family protein [Cryomorpha ignava]|uniref:Flavodoxin family protein n=1 Tax=Cryomorpha ignava TaxID=101383 RepID=A0A7K3WUM8_9FLAO|nr:NAD(P)H-dependent oxidoreductase [Cryomorpha ignava]NEN24751.1 flavodoxin family protein [Cryomorpha ignava]